MKTGTYTRNLSNFYNENLLPIGAAFDDEGVPIVRTGGSGTQQANYNTNEYVDGGRGIMSFNDKNSALVFNFAASLEYTIPKNGAFILSIRAKNTNENNRGKLTILIDVDGLEVESMVCDFTDLPVGQFLNFAQKYDHVGGQVVNYRFKHETNASNPQPSTIYFDALQLEFADKDIDGPTMYKPPTA